MRATWVEWHGDQLDPPSDAPDPVWLALHNGNIVSCPLDNTDWRKGDYAMLPSGANITHYCIPYGFSPTAPDYVVDALMELKA